MVRRISCGRFSASGTWMTRLYSPGAGAAAGREAGQLQGLAVDVVGEAGVFDPGRPVVQVGDLVVAEAVDVVLLQQVAGHRVHVVAGELLAVVHDRPEGSLAADHRARDAGVEVDLVVGEGGVDVLEDDVQDHCHPLGVAAVDQVLQASRPARPLIGRQVVQRPVSPVEVQLQAGDRHQLQAGYAEALQVRQPVDHALEGAVEFLGVHLVDNQVRKLGNLPVAIVPLEGRNRRRRVERRQLPDFVRRPGERVSEPEREKGRRSGRDPI